MERRGLIFVDAKLNHWHIRPWIDVAAHGPGGVVEPPTLFQFNGQGSEQLPHTTGQLGITWRRIFHFVQLSWKSAEVVDRAGSMFTVAAALVAYQWAEMHRTAWGRGILSTIVA
jgi:hypothetical protein